MVEQKKSIFDYGNYSDFEESFDLEINSEDEIDYENIFEDELKSDNPINLIGYLYDEIEEIEDIDENGNPIFKNVNHSKRAKANNVETDKFVTKYMNYALEYFDNRCALSGEKFVVFDKPIKRGEKNIITNLSSEHIVALSLGGNNIVPNLVPSVYQYNIQKNGYYILDWWNKAKNIEGKPIYNTARHLKLINYMLKSLKIRKDLGIKKSPERYRELLLEPNEVDEFLKKDEIRELLISDIITATTEDADGKKILTQIPKYEGNIPSLSKQKDIRITEEMFLQDSINLLEKEGNLPDNIIDELKNMYEEIKNEISFERDFRQCIVDVLNDMEIENQYTVSNDILINTDLLEKVRGISDKGVLKSIIKKELESQTSELKTILSESQMHIASSNMPAIFYDKKEIDRIKFWKENRGEYFEDILKRGGKNAVDNFIDIIIKLEKIGVDVSKMGTTEGKSDNIETLAQKSGVSREKLIEVGLNPKYGIFDIKHEIAASYRKVQMGKKTSIVPPTIEQIKELLEKGISLEKQENTTEKFINVLKKLKEIGVDISKMGTTEGKNDNIETLAQKSGISKEKLIEVGLDPEYNILNTKYKIAVLYRKSKVMKEEKVDDEKIKGIPPTEEQVKELLEMGISLEIVEQESITERFINVLKKLKEIGVDISKIGTTNNKRDTVETLAQKSGISKEKLIEAGLNTEYCIGEIKKNIGRLYRKEQVLKKEKKGIVLTEEEEKLKKIKGIPPTEEQVQELLELGISLEGKKGKNKIKQTIQENKEDLAEALECGAKIEVEILKAEKDNEKGANENRDGRN